ncbi:MAG: ABC transporter substrate-binding protein [Ruminiclostridium sp.]|nr:ABC transporter substrate-binding protein [Ruminiclostridium sp.]
MDHRNAIRRSLGAAAAVFMLLACGCDSKPAESTETVDAQDSVMRVTGELLIDDSDDEPSEYPVTINDTVIRKRPEKVICLSSSLTEIICELGFGDSLIGRGSYCSYPESVAALTDYGKPASPDFEAIKNAAPDLVVTATSVSGKDVTALSESGIAVLYIPSPRSLDEYGRIYSALGMVYEGLFDGEKTGNDAFSAVKNALAGCGLSLGNFVYVTEGGAVAGGDTFESSVLSLFGHNIAENASGYSFDKSLLKDEQPDIIVLNSDVSKEELLGDEVFGSLDAVTAGKIISVSNSYFESPSGRITALADELGAGEKVESDEA